MRKRILKESNYKAFYYDGKTLRQAIDASQPITELPYPEFLDIKITDKCNGGCPWCYQDSSMEGEHAKEVLLELHKMFLPMPIELRPFQVAIGGGEPTLYPDFTSVMATLFGFGITPNFTTNGTFIYSETCQDIIEMTKETQGAIAVSTHEQMDVTWMAAARFIADSEIKVNLHCIISDQESIVRFWEIYNEFKDIIEYFVLLPHEAVGRAQHKTIEADKLFMSLVDAKVPENVAFGANFHPHLTKHPIGYKYSIYDPEAFSGYLDLVDRKLYKSSFDLTEKDIPMSKCLREI